ncbi:MAG: hypothetical protein JWM11_7496 [Planctomycetaceae bacterium]|nr:hypothetical protein [Planctomycetaceae bacterium]
MRSLACCLGIVVLVCCVQLGTAEDAPPAGASPVEAPMAETPPVGTPPAAEKSHAHSDHHTDALIAEEVRQSLMKPVTFKCDHAALAEVLANRIAAPSKLDVYMDMAKIEEAGIPFDDLVVTGDFKNTSIRALLTRILPPLKLAYFCDDTGVCITTKDAHDQYLFARVYDVTDLIPASIESGAPVYYGSPNSPQPFIPNEQSIPPSSGSVSAPPSTSLSNRNVPVAAIPVKPVQFGGAANPMALDIQFPHANWNQALTGVSLATAVKQATGANFLDAWSPQGNKGTVSVLNTGHAKLMVVRNSEAIHAEVEDLLAEVYTHHHMLKSDSPKADAAPKTAGPKIVRPQVRVTNLKRH